MYICIHTQKHPSVSLIMPFEKISHSFEASRERLLHPCEPLFSNRTHLFGVWTTLKWVVGKLGSMHQSSPQRVFPKSSFIEIQPNSLIYGCFPAPEKNIWSTKPNIYYLILTKMPVNPWSQQMHISVSSDPKDSRTFKKESLLMYINSAILVLGISPFSVVTERREKGETDG